MRVLVVDDDPAVRQVVALALEPWAVQEAADGASALAALHLDEIDVVLLDVMMPTFDGFTVLEAIRAEPSLADMPVVLLTARVSEDDHLRGYRAGADGYLTKPFDIDVLLALVEAVAGRDTDERERFRAEQLGRAEVLAQVEHLLG